MGTGLMACPLWAATVTGCPAADQGINRPTSDASAFPDLADTILTGVGGGKLYAPSVTAVALRSSTDYTRARFNMHNFVFSIDVSASAQVAKPVVKATHITNFAADSDLPAVDSATVPASLPTIALAPVMLNANDQIIPDTAPTNLTPANTAKNDPPPSKDNLPMNTAGDDVLKNCVIVPLPPSGAMGLLGLACVGFVALRRRRWV